MLFWHGPPTLFNTGTFNSDPDPDWIQLGLWNRVREGKLSPKELDVCSGGTESFFIWEALA
jgi:hypothetical protein